MNTNLFIDYWKRPTDALRTIFKKSDIAFCGVIRAELLHGTVSKNNFDEMTLMMEAFDELNPTPESWQHLGSLLYKLCTHGITVPFTDALIAIVAIENNIPVWTDDKNFDLMNTVIPELKFCLTEELIWSQLYVASR